MGATAAVVRRLLVLSCVYYIQTFKCIYMCIYFSSPLDLLSCLSILDDSIFTLLQACLYIYMYITYAYRYAIMHTCMSVVYDCSIPEYNHICISICIYLFRHICIYIYLHIPAYMPTFISMYICTYASRYIHILHRPMSV